MNWLVQNIINRALFITAFLPVQLAIASALISSFHCVPAIDKHRSCLILNLLGLPCPKFISLLYIFIYNYGLCVYLIVQINLFLLDFIMMLSNTLFLEPLIWGSSELYPMLYLILLPLCYLHICLSCFPQLIEEKSYLIWTPDALLKNFFRLASISQSPVFLYDFSTY